MAAESPGAAAGRAGTEKGSTTLSTTQLDDGATVRAPASVSGEAALAADQRLDIIRTSLEDSKAEDIKTIDITGKSALADHMVIASGRSHRHVGAIADQLTRALKDAGLDRPRIEGLPHCDWVLIDSGDVIVHIFRPEVRDFYNLEKMWSAEPYSARRAQA